MKSQTIFPSAPYKIYSWEIIDRQSKYLILKNLRPDYLIGFSTSVVSNEYISS